jgi:chemotaxis response regulator CheB
MRVIVCDDDAMVRSVVGTVVEEHGMEVVGEAEDLFGAVELLNRTAPDIAIVDLALRISTGLEVVQAAWESGCRVIIFSSYITPDLMRAGPDGPVAIEKPHFDQLGDALDHVATSITTQGQERRSRDRGTQRADGFARAVAEAQPGDAIVILEPPVDHQSELEIVNLTAARVTAAQDRIEATTRQVRMVLACAGEGGARAVIERIATTAELDLSGWELRIAVVTDDLPGVDAFEQIREAELQA